MGVSEELCADPAIAVLRKNKKAEDQKTMTKSNNGLRKYVPATDISFCTNGYPTGDFNGPGQKQNCGYWIPRVSAGSWKGFGSSRKRLSAKENQGIYSDKNVLKIAYISVL